MTNKLISFLGKIFFLFKKQRIPEDPKKIVIIRSGAIGDVVMTTPLIRAIRNHYPKAELCYLVGNWSKQVLDGNKNIDRIIPFEDEIVYKKKILGIRRLIKQIKKERFDLGFVLDKSYHWGVLGFLFKIKARIGFDRFGEGFANNINVSYDGTKNEADYNLELAEKIGAESVDKQHKKLEYPANAKDDIFAANILKKNNIKGKIIGITPGGASNPGQTMDVKRWPAERYSELTKRLCQKYNIIIFGGPGDAEIGEKIAAEADSKKVLNIAGKTTLQQSAALMKKCNLVVAHDSGPMHLAATSGTKVITLFGPTPAKRFAPKDAIVIESKLDGCPCYDVYGNYRKDIDCMQEISVDEVYNKIIKAL